MGKPQGTEQDLNFEEDGETSFADGADSDYDSFLRISPAERRLLKQRIAEADKGIFISGEAMHRWIDSWGTDTELPPPEPDIFPPSGK